MPPCHRCGCALLLLARLPHTITRADGAEVAGTRGVGLCPACDRDDPAAQGLLAFFAVYETVTDASVESAAELISEWVDHVETRWSEASRDQHAVAEEEFRHWRSGDF